MKMPIPSDWDGQSTCDYKVTWPNSDTWRRILRGLLTQPDISDFWDETTGDLDNLLVKFDPVMISALDGLECGDMNIPIGSIFLFAGGVLPDNWLMCDGHAELQTDYPALAELIGDNFHPGGITTPEYFYLPDLRGRVPVGVKAGDSDFGFLGNKGGAKTHTLTINEMPSHSHNPIYYFTQSDGAGTPVPSAIDAGANAGRWVSAPQIYDAGNTGGSQSHNNLQPYLAINFMIRAK